jgi:hypothetical protein
MLERGISNRCSRSMLNPVSRMSNTAFITDGLSQKNRQFLIVASGTEARDDICSLNFELLERGVPEGCSRSTMNPVSRGSSRSLPVARELVMRSAH